MAVNLRSLGLGLGVHIIAIVGVILLGVLTSIDVIMCFDAFHHFPDKEGILGEFHRVLKDGGILIFSENFLHGTDRRYQDYWSSRSLLFIKYALHQAGFIMLSRRPLLYIMGSPVDSKSNLAQRLWDRITRSISGRERLGFFIGMLL